MTRSQAYGLLSFVWRATSMVAQRGPDQVWAGAVRTSISVLTTSKTENLDPTVVAGLFLWNESH